MDCVSTISDIGVTNISQKFSFLYRMDKSRNFNRNRNNWNSHISISKNEEVVFLPFKKSDDYLDICTIFSFLKRYIQNYLSICTLTQFPRSNLLQRSQEKAIKGNLSLILPCLVVCWMMRHNRRNKNRIQLHIQLMVSPLHETGFLFSYSLESLCNSFLINIFGGY